MKRILVVWALLVCWLAGCSASGTAEKLDANAAAATVEHHQTAAPSSEPSPAIPNLQAELADGQNTTSTSQISSFDFRNFTYELPRGWQNPDGTAEMRLVDGKAAPIAKDIDQNLDDEQRAAAKSQRRIGMSLVTVKYMDLTGDGADEAVVVLKIETGGSALPQIAYVFRWKNSAPEQIWYFRTGDRADGGLKNFFPDNGLFIVELYGQDRFILGQIETGKITGDEEQLCCPTHFTRSAYKWNGSTFLLTGKRHTFSLADPSAPPQENLGDKVNAPQKSKK
jgi:hypothetical protein